MSQSEASELLFLRKNGVWLSGIPAGLFGVVDRAIASLADGYVSLVDLLQIFAAVSCFLFWLSLKPKLKLNEGQPNI
jgi:hypothetical protein